MSPSHLASVVADTPFTDCEEHHGAIHIEPNAISIVPHGERSVGGVELQVRPVLEEGESRVQVEDSDDDDDDPPTLSQLSQQQVLEESATSHPHFGNPYALASSQENSETRFPDTPPGTQDNGCYSGTQDNGCYSESHTQSPSGQHEGQHAHSALVPFQPLNSLNWQETWALPEVDRNELLEVCGDAFTNKSKDSA